MGQSSFVVAAATQLLAFAVAGAEALTQPSAITETTKSSNFGTTWVKPVYIRSMGAFLPNEPVPNSGIEKHIGSINSTRSAKIREKILSMNGIKNRYYAMIEGNPTHLNVDLAAEAVHAALHHSGGVSLGEVGMLATGTSMADVLMPGFAHLLHGTIGANHSMDCLSSGGVCLCSTSALKAASHSLSLGEHNRALVVGSEASSHLAHAERFNQKGFDTDSSDILDPMDAFKAEFLRYMLSDGAGCALLDTEPHPTKLSFRIEQFYHHSFSHLLPPCMVFGVRKPGKRIALEDIYKTNSDDFLYCQQDTFLLSKQIIRRCRESLRLAIDQGFLGETAKIDWVLPHLSSYFFDEKISEVCHDLLGVPKDRIWTNLSEVGNVGAASPLLLLWGALQGANGQNGPDIKTGDRILLGVPESGSFSFQFVLLEVVNGTGTS